MVEFNEDHFEIIMKKKIKRIPYTFVSQIVVGRAFKSLFVITKDGKCYYFSLYFKDYYKEMLRILHKKTGARLVKLKMFG